jgi:hypothetical protein
LVIVAYFLLFVNKKFKKMAEIRVCIMELRLFAQIPRGRFVQKAEFRLCRVCTAFYGPFSADEM